MSSPAGRTTTELIQACTAGDQAAWRELIDRYGRLVTSIAAGYRFSQPDIDDVFQTVFVRCFESLASLSEPGKFSAWLITTTHRACWRLSKRSRRYRDFESALSEPIAPSADPLIEGELQYLMNEALRELNGRCEELLRAIYFEPAEPDYQELANRFRMSPNSVGPTRARCFEKLEGLLAKRGFFGRDAKPDQSRTD